MDNQQRLIVLHRELCLYVAAWLVRVFEGERLHVYVWLSIFAVHLKPSHNIVNRLYPSTK